jgi:hypothetical protein
MPDDPIVEELHGIRESLLREHGGLDGYVAHLREMQIAMKDRVVTQDRKRRRVRSVRFRKRANAVARRTLKHVRGLEWLGGRRARKRGPHFDRFGKTTLTCFDNRMCATNGRLVASQFESTETIE